MSSSPKIQVSRSGNSEIAQTYCFYSICNTEFDIRRIGRSLRKYIINTQLKNIKLVSFLSVKDNFEQVLAYIYFYAATSDKSDVKFGIVDEECHRYENFHVWVYTSKKKLIQFFLLLEINLLKNTFFLPLSFLKEPWFTLGVVYIISFLNKNIQRYFWDFL